MLVVGIDPGLDTGMAYIENGELVFAGLTDPTVYNLPECFVFIECPRIYPGGGTPNPNDLITLAVQVGEYKLHFERIIGAKVQLVRPSEWKGQQPKYVTEKRMYDRFPGVNEYLEGVSSSKRHNVFDAIGIAAYGYDKLTRN